MFPSPQGVGAHTQHVAITQGKEENVSFKALLDKYFQISRHNLSVPCIQSIYCMYIRLHMYSIYQNLALFNGLERKKRNIHHNHHGLHNVVCLKSSKIKVKHCTAVLTPYLILL